MIIAQIATIPTRTETVMIAARSLRPQVDQLRIIRNSPSDGWKFKDLTRYGLDDIIFICDDDIEYPPDFVAAMLHYLKPGIVLTVMGKILNSRPINSYYRDEHTYWKTFEANEKVARIEVPGTCGMAFHRSTCPDLDHEYFKIKNCADIWMAIYCKEHSIPVYVIPHPADWFKDLCVLLPKGSPCIFTDLRDNDGEITRLVNERL